MKSEPPIATLTFLLAALCVVVGSTPQAADQSKPAAGQTEPLRIGTPVWQY